MWLDSFVDRDAYWSARNTIVRLRVQSEYPWHHDLRELHNWALSDYTVFAKRVPDRMLDLTLIYLDSVPPNIVEKLEYIETLHLSSDGTVNADRTVERWLNRVRAPRLRTLRLRGSEDFIIRSILERQNLTLSLDIYMKEHAPFKRDRLASIGRRLLASGHLPGNLKALTCPQLPGFAICGEDLLGTQ